MTPTWLSAAKIAAGAGTAYTIVDMNNAKAFTTLPQKAAAAGILVGAVALLIRGATQLVYGGN